VSSANTPWLEVEAGSAHSPAKVQTVYALALGRTGAGGMLEWEGTTTISSSVPIRAGMDHLDVQVPAECEVLDGEIPFDKDTRIAHLLFGPGQAAFSSVSFKVRYHLPPP